MKKSMALSLPVLVLLAACGGERGGDAPEQQIEEVAPAPQRQGKADCQTVTFEAANFTHCLADPEVHRISTRLMGEDKEPLRSLTALALESDARRTAFAMNGGMFDEQGMPIGYYVENGARLHEINQAGGKGNFYLKPNGIFFGRDGEWRILPTARFAATVSERPEFATQSGPMLLIDGALNPNIAENGESTHIRNAVGIDEEGRAHFVISDDAVSFGTLARFMLEELKTPNALYLDGSISALWDAGTDRFDMTTGLGPLILVERKPAAAQDAETQGIQKENNRP